MGALARRAHLQVFRLFKRTLGAKGGPPRDGGLEYRLMWERDVLRFCGEAELELPESKLREAYAREDLCVAALDGDRLAGYCWFAFSETSLQGPVSIAFPREVVYTYKSYVRPEYRGRGIAPKLYLYADGLLRERGRSIALIFVHSHNRASIAAARRSGFAGAGWAGYVLPRDRMLS
jgi:GNAT superfamily N-acetyltransferase